MQKIYIKDKNDMSKFAKVIANKAQIADIFALSGNLGAGKSFFAREFINFLSDREVNVLSPTFNIIYSYKSSKGEIFHFDLYRIKLAQELENIGFFDYLQNGICLIEWPEIAKKFLPKNFYEIEILIGKNEDEREIIIKNYPHMISF